MAAAPPPLPHKGARPPPRAQTSSWCPLPWRTAPRPGAHCSAAPQAVPTPPAPVLSAELTSGARGSAPRPGCPAGGADGLGGSHCALPSWTNGGAVLGGFEVPARLIFPWARRLPRVWVPCPLRSSLWGIRVPAWFLLSVFCSTQLGPACPAPFGG